MTFLPLWVRSAVLGPRTTSSAETLTDGSCGKRVTDRSHCGNWVISFRCRSQGVQNAVSARLGLRLGLLIGMAGCPSIVIYPNLSMSPGFTD